MKIAVTREQIDACIAANEAALVNHIRECGQSHPPADGAIGRITANIEALRRMEPGVSSPAKYVPPFSPGDLVSAPDGSVGRVIELVDYHRQARVEFAGGDETTFPVGDIALAKDGMLSFRVRAQGDEVDVGATDSGKRVTVKRKVLSK